MVNPRPQCRQYEIVLTGSAEVLFTENTDVSVYHYSSFKGRSGGDTHQIQWQRQRDPSLVSSYLIHPMCRWQLCISSGAITLVNWHVWYGPVLYFAELYVVITTALFLLIAGRCSCPRRWRPLIESDPVDVLIPTYNETSVSSEPVVVGCAQRSGCAAPKCWCWMMVTAKRSRPWLASSAPASSHD